MSLPTPSLPDGWIERLWAQMRATYGASFDRQWECPQGADPAEHVAGIKAHWARELGMFLHNPEALRYGLEHLPPDYPPNLLQFRAACNRRPEAARPALEGPKADPSKVAEALSKLRSIPHRTSAREWAYALKARDEAGERLSILQREMYRDALRGDIAIAVDEDELQEARAA
jgi:hypothetical protein